MRDAASYAINHPPGVADSDPITIKFFKKGACDSPTLQGYSCRFDWQVASANLGASCSRIVMVYDGVAGPKFDRIFAPQGMSNAGVVFSPDGKSLCLLRPDRQRARRHGRRQGILSRLEGQRAGRAMNLQSCTAMNFSANSI